MENCYLVTIETTLCVVGESERVAREQVSMLPIMSSSDAGHNEISRIKRVSSLAEIPDPVLDLRPIGSYVQQVRDIFGK